MERWADKIAVVTGASAGIGASIAEKLVDAGVQVVGLARRLERLEELSSKFSGRRGKFIPLKTDISNKDDIIRAFEHISKNIGPVSILVNNAGISRKSHFVNGNVDDWKKVLDTNLFGLAVATRQAIKSMQEHNIEGHIININSILGHQVLKVPNMNVYPASKFASRALMETLRMELLDMGSKIKTTSISPGLVMTEMCEASGGTSDPEYMERIINAAPFLNSEDIANGVMYALGTPPHVQITELTIRPVGELF